MSNDETTEFCEDCGDVADDCVCMLILSRLREAGIPITRETISNDCGGGFGLPWIIVRVGDVEIAPIGRDSYAQDGSDPLEIDGWAWRLAARLAANQVVCSTGWSDCVSTPAEALALARAALALADKVQP